MLYIEKLSVILYLIFSEKRIAKKYIRKKTIQYENTQLAHTH